MAPDIKYYYMPGACSIAAHVLLADSGLKYESIKCDFHGNPASHAEFKKNVNPKGQVPTIVIDGEVITEAPAVMTAISNLVPQKGYTGRTPKENIRFLEWMNYLSGTMHSKNFGALFAPGSLTTDPKVAPTIAEQAKKNIQASLKYIDDKLEAQGSPDYALGDDITGVDVELMIFWLWAHKFKINLAPYLNYERILTTLGQNPAYISTMTKEGLMTFT